MSESNRPAPPAQEPIPMLLWCPGCGGRHVDVGEFAHKSHHTHACQHCGLVWRPALVATVGVQFLPGFKNDGEEEEDRRCTAAIRPEGTLGNPVFCSRPGQHEGPHWFASVEPRCRAVRGPGTSGPIQCQRPRGHSDDEHRAIYIVNGREVCHYWTDWNRG